MYTAKELSDRARASGVWCGKRSRASVSRPTQKPTQSRLSHMARLAAAMEAPPIHSTKGRPNSRDIQTTTQDRPTPSQAQPTLAGSRANQLRRAATMPRTNMVTYCGTWANSISQTPSSTFQSSTFFQMRIRKVLAKSQSTRAMSALCAVAGAMGSSRSLAGLRSAAPAQSRYTA